MINAISDRTQGRPPFITFEERAIEDREASIREGRYMTKSVDYVILRAIGSKDTVEKPVDEWLEHERRMATAPEISQLSRTPIEWLEHYERSYQRWKNGQEATPNGTPIREWPAVSKSQAQNLTSAGVLTVEDLAALTAEGQQRVGMGSGELKRKAQAWLAAAQDTGKIAEENAALKVKVEQQDETIQELRTRLDQLASRLEASEDAGTGSGKSGSGSGGRKRA